MNLIGRYRNSGFEAVSDAVSEFFGRRQDLQRPGVAFGPEGDDLEELNQIQAATWDFLTDEFVYQLDLLPFDREDQFTPILSNSTPA